VGKTKYREGDVFAVPLADGGYGLGVVARAKRGVYLGYLFGDVHAQIPALELLRLRPDDTVLVPIGGDQGLAEGHWPVLGQLPGWDRDDWPMPWFVEWSPPEQQYRVLSSCYPDDPTKSLGLPEVKVTREEASGMPLNAGYPWPALEKEFNQLLHHDPRPLAKVRIVPGPPAPIAAPSEQVERAPEEAVRVYFQFPQSGLSDADTARLDVFEEGIDAVLQMDGTGYVDGSEQGEGEYVLYLYGRDRYAIWAAVKRKLKFSPIPAVSVYLREADLDAEPTIITP